SYIQFQDLVQAIGAAAQAITGRACSSSTIARALQRHPSSIQGGWKDRSPDLPKIRALGSGVPSLSTAISSPRGRRTVRAPRALRGVGGGRMEQRARNRITRGAACDRLVFGTMLRILRPSRAPRDGGVAERLKAHAWK